MQRSFAGSDGDGKAAATARPPAAILLHLNWKSGQVHTHSTLTLPQLAFALDSFTALLQTKPFMCFDIGAQYRHDKKAD